MRRVGELLRRLRSLLAYIMDRTKEHVPLNVRLLKNVKLMYEFRRRLAYALTV